MEWLIRREEKDRQKKVFLGLGYIGYEKCKSSGMVVWRERWWKLVKYV